MGRMTSMSKQAVKRPRLIDLNEFITCYLCGGYLIDATILSECTTVHSFCKSCIVRHVKEMTEETGRRASCPICDIPLNESKPTSSMRSDRKLQEIVYKLVPGLYKSEMAKRRSFFSESSPSPSSSSSDSGLGTSSLSTTSPGSSPSSLLSPEERGEPSERTTFYVPEDKISISLEYYYRKSKGVKDDSQGQNDKNEGNKKRKKPPDEDDDDGHDRKYLRVQAGMPVSLLKKFIVQKFALDSRHHVQLMFSGNVLTDDLTVMDVIYIYSWSSVTEPMRFTYRVEVEDEEPVATIPSSPITTKKKFTFISTVTSKGITIVRDTSLTSTPSRSTPSAISPSATSPLSSPSARSQVSSSDSSQVVKKTPSSSPTTTTLSPPPPRPVTTSNSSMSPTSTTLTVVTSVCATSAAASSTNCTTTAGNSLSSTRSNVSSSTSDSQLTKKHPSSTSSSSSPTSTVNSPRPAGAATSSTVSPKPSTMSGLPPVTTNSSTRITIAPSSTSHGKNQSSPSPTISSTSMSPKSSTPTVQPGPTSGSGLSTRSNISSSKNPSSPSTTLDLLPSRTTSSTTTIRPSSLPTTTVTSIDRSSKHSTPTQSVGRVKQSTSCHPLAASLKTPSRSSSTSSSSFHLSTQTKTPSPADSRSSPTTMDFTFRNLPRAMAHQSAASKYAKQAELLRVPNVQPNQHQLEGFYRDLLSQATAFPGLLPGNNRPPTTIPRTSHIPVAPIDHRPPFTASSFLSGFHHRTPATMSPTRRFGPDDQPQDLRLNRPTAPSAAPAHRLGSMSFNDHLTRLHQLHNIKKAQIDRK